MKNKKKSINDRLLLRNYFLSFINLINLKLKYLKKIFSVKKNSLVFFL